MPSEATFRFTLGPVLAGSLVGALYLDHILEQQEILPKGLIMALGTTLFAAGSGVELARMWRAKNLPATPLQGLLCATLGSLLLPIAVWWSAHSPTAPGNLPLPWIMPPMALVTVFLLTMFLHTRKRQCEDAISHGAGSLWLMCYPGILASFLTLIRMEHTVQAAVSIILITKSCDIGAYITGATFRLGKHKLIPWLSPGKSWEGLIGGILFSGTLCALASHYGLLPKGPWYIAGPLGMLLGYLGQCGDLLGSLCKRDANIKDASKAIPGFGGFLDILDSPMAIAPLAWLVLHLIGN